MRRLLLSTLFSIAFFIGISQSIFVNELHYDNAGADVDEGIEIAGPAGTDLTGYSIELYNGGTDVLYGSIVALSGVIPAQNNGYGTINFPVIGIQNGAPDGFALIDGSGIVVQFLSYEGVIGAAAGTAAGTNSTDIGVSETSSTPVGESLQLVGVGNIYTDFTWTTQGHTKGALNTGQSFGATLPPTVSFDVISTSINEAIGTAAININITNADSNPTSVDIALGISTATGGGVDFTYSSPTTVTFPASSSTQQTVSIAIIDDGITETFETIVLELQNVTNNGVFGNNISHTISIDDNDINGITACSELFFSEYMEGSLFNKFIEIYNPSNSIMDMSDYEIRLYENGSSTPTATLNPIGFLVPGDVFVIANGQAQASILLEADTTSIVANFDGNDAFELYKISAGIVVDVFGEAGSNPGSAWTIGTGSSSDNVLVRMASVDAGTSAWTGVGNLQWDVYPTLDTLFVGSHTNTGCSSSTPLTAYASYSFDSICAGQTVNFYSNSNGGNTPYIITWDFGDGSATSNIENPTHVYSGGTAQYNVSLTVDDGTTVDFSTILYTSLGNPTGNFNMLNPFCEIDTVDLIAGGTGNNISYSYALEAGLVLNNLSSISGNGHLHALSDGSFDITQYTTDLYGCMDSITQNITVSLFESASFSAITSVCEGAIVPLNHAAAIGSWSGTNVTDLTNGLGEFNSTGLTPGLFDITYDIIGFCPDSHTESVEVYQTPVPDYASTAAGHPTVDFMDLSIGTMASYLWNFGDGNTSELTNPTHTYAANGIYTVCLTVTTGNDCTDSICSQIQVATVSISDNNINEISIYPNPTSNDKITIANKNNEILTIRISNIIGQKVWAGTINKTETINLPDLQKGNYFVKITSEKLSVTKKLIVN